MGLITFLKPLEKPRELPVRQELDVRTGRGVKLTAVAVLAAVAVFYVLFW